MQVVEISEPREPLGLGYGLTSGLFRKLPENEASTILFKLIEDIVSAISQKEKLSYTAKNKELFIALSSIRFLSNGVGFVKLT